MTLSRRQLGSLSAAAGLGLAAPALRAQTREVVFGMAVPLSGPWARLGELSELGARFAVDEINESGGIRSLGGARIRLAVVDVGDSPEKSKTAAERLLAQEPQLVGGAGAYVSSFTLAVTEVTERAGVPWLTLSYSDLITDRGFRHVYQTSPTANEQAANALPTIIELGKAATGRAPATMGIVMDNTASPVAFTRGLRDGGAQRLGVRIVVDEVFTPPLSDAGPLMQRVRAARPDILLLLPTAIPDIKLTLEKLNEIGLGRGRLPIINNGGPMGSPDLLRLVGPNLLEGAMFITATWGMKGQEALLTRFREKTGQPWMTQDSLSHYGHMMILRDAVERAASTDRAKVNEAIRALDLTEGPAAGAYPGGRIKFDEKGRRVGAQLVIAQWQNGTPMTIFPRDRALAQPIWPRR